MRRTLSLAWVLATLVAVTGLALLHLKESSEVASYSLPFRAELLTPGMTAFLATDAARLHCCAPERALDAAGLFQRAADSLAANDPAVLQNLRLAAYFIYFAGDPMRARLTMMRAGDVARAQGATRFAQQAYLEAAHMALSVTRPTSPRDSLPAP
jgi:hypothetical protein